MAINSGLIFNFKSEISKYILPSLECVAAYPVQYKAQPVPPRPGRLSVLGGADVPFWIGFAVGGREGAFG